MNGEYRRSALGEYSALEDVKVETANVEKISSRIDWKGRGEQSKTKLT